MRLGVDVSSYLDERDNNIKYFDNGKEVDPYQLLKNNNVNLIRLRVWNDPYSEDGKPYLAGTNSVDRDIEIIEELKKYNFDYLINFHYSDFWVDPGKQTLPKAWKSLSFEELLAAVYDFTKESLLKFKALGINIPYVQIGNEITKGIMWPMGQIIENDEGKIREGYPHLIKLLNQGIKAAREVLPEVKIIIHLEKSDDYKIYQEYFTELEKAHVNYDVIGMSYYPYWHGTFEQLFFNIDNCRNLFHKNVMIMETSYGFTLEDYMVSSDGINQMKAGQDGHRPYPITKEGQAQFVSELIRLSKEKDIEGIVYWEPLWLPNEDKICWCSLEAQEYINEVGKSTRNEWSNQCLFDYKGNKLPAFDKYKL